MPRQRAFTVIELLVVIAIIAVLVGLLFPAIGAVQRHARQTESNMHVRNIIQGLIQASESRRGFFPGFDGSSFIKAGVDTTGDASRPGQTAEARFWILLDGSFTSADQVISPQESKIAWTSAKVTIENYSYAMMKIAGGTNLSASDPSNVGDRYRREEWRNEQNALAPIVTDRLAIDGSILPTEGTPSTYLSIHDGSQEGEWIGSIGRGDLSVEFSDSAEVPTRIAGYNNVDDPNTTNVNEDDDIFTQDDGTGVTLEDPKKNASMTYRGIGNPMGDIQ